MGGLSKSQLRDAVRAGAIVAIPKKGESSEAAIARVQKKHPGRKVVDPPAAMVEELQADLHAELADYENGNHLKQYREAIAHSHGHGQFVRSGNKILPRPVAESHLQAISDDWMETETKIGVVPESWKVAPTVYRTKMQGQTLDRRFSLHQLHKDKLHAHVEIGRRWTPNFSAKYEFIQGRDWGASSIKMQPAYASLANEQVDRSTISALQALGFSFPGARSSEIVIDARGPIKFLSESTFNPVRYLVRLACLYLTASIVEEQGSMISVVGADGTPEINYLHSAGDISRNVINAVHESRQVVYVESGKFGSDVRMLEVFLTALTDKLQFQTGDRGVNIPAISKLWPQIPNTQLVIYGPQEPALNYGTLKSGEIWNAIAYYTALMNVRELWEEVFTSVATLAWRPENCNNFMGHKSVRMALPISVMQSAALGPLMLNMSQWRDRNTHLPIPEIAQVAWLASARYTQWALLYRDISAMLGGDELFVMASHVDFVRRMEWMVYSGTINTPINTVIEKVATRYGWENLLGRMLLTLQGLNVAATPKAAATHIAVPLKDVNAIQWEEALPYSNLIPEGSAALSLVYPASPTSIPVAGTWIRPTSVINRHGIADAMYSMLNINTGRVGYSIWDPHFQKIQIVRKTVMRNYRGALADAQFFTVSRSDEASIDPLIWMNSNHDAMELYAKARYNSASEWFISEDAVVDEDDYIKYYRTLTDSFPDTLQAMQDALRIDFITEIYSDEEDATEETEEFEETESEMEEPLPGVIGGITALAVRKRAKNIELALGRMPKWVAATCEAILIGKSPVTKPKTDPYVKIALEDLEVDDPSAYPMQTTQNHKIAQMMGNVAFFLNGLSPFIADATTKLATHAVATGADNIAKTHQYSGGTWDAASYTRLTGKALPQHITAEEFNKYISMGATPQRLIYTTDPEEYVKYLEIITEQFNLRLQDIMVGRGELTNTEAEELLKTQMQAEASGGYAYRVPKKLSPDEVKERLRAKSAALSESQRPIMETGSVVSPTEPVEVTAGGSGFGGAAPSQDNGGEDPNQQRAPAASSAPPTSPKITELQFQAPKGPDQS
jgi:hypothetical protein